MLFRSPEDLVKVGDEIEAYVMQVSDRDCQVKLSKKRLEMCIRDSV